MKNKDLINESVVIGEGWPINICFTVAVDLLATLSGPSDNYHGSNKSNILF